MKNLDEIAGRIQARLDEKDTVREIAIKSSRAIIRLSGSVVHSLHKKERVDEACAGELVAIMGPKNSTTGDTLCDPDAPIVLESIEFYKPVISVAVEPRTIGDQDRLTASLERIAEEDITTPFSYC